jgi:soluble lytic murein transglycosylase
MLRILRTLVLFLAGAAICAAAALLWLSPDPAYVALEWLNGSGYYAYDPMIREAGRKYSIDPMLIKAIVWRESAFQPKKVGGSGERGLMQVGEAAARDWAKSEKIETFVPTDLLDAKTNLNAGVWYFHKALERWKARDDPIPFALGEYNAGRSRVERWIASTQLKEQATAADLLAAMDYPTTRQYIEDITARYHFYKKRGRL